MNICSEDHIQLAPEIPEVCGCLQNSPVFWEQHPDDGV